MFYPSGMIHLGHSYNYLTLNDSMSQVFSSKTKKQEISKALPVRKHIKRLNERSEKCQTSASHCFYAILSLYIFLKAVPIHSDKAVKAKIAERRYLYRATKKAMLPVYLGFIFLKQRSVQSFSELRISQQKLRACAVGESRDIGREYLSGLKDNTSPIHPSLLGIMGACGSPGR